MELERARAALRERYGAPVISAVLRWDGGESELLAGRAFRAGTEQLEAGLAGARLTVLARREEPIPGGRAALYAVEGTARDTAAVCASLREGWPLAGLFDLEDGENILGAQIPPPGEARRRMAAYFALADRERAAALVTRALLDEVCATPKPGLVDRANNGSHRDMSLFTFTASAAALAPYWRRCVQIGQDTAEQGPEETFRALRRAGQGAERAMFAATGGVNTHKGAIFTLGIICGTVGRLWRPESPCRDPETILAQCAALAAGAARRDFAALRDTPPRTAGERLYAEQGITGIRGEAAQGFPSVSQIALPALRRALAAGRSRNDAAVLALLSLIARVADTNMLSRGGPEEARSAAEDCARLLEGDAMPSMKAVSRLDEAFIRQNLSPGGCADLLSAALFLWDWSQA